MSRDRANRTSLLGTVFSALSLSPEPMKRVLRPIRALYRDFARLLSHLWRKDTRYHYVLMPCTNAMMAGYTASVWNVLRDDKRLRCFWTTKPGERRAGERARIRKILPLPEFNFFLAIFFRWDMIIVPCHDFQGLTDTRRWPVIHVPHGPGDGTFGDTKNSYCYGKACYDRKGKRRFSCMLEGSQKKKDLVVRALPELEDVIEVVGSPVYDKLLRQSGRREEIRRDLGFSDDQTVVFVISTFREASLFKAYGDEILTAARPLLGKFQFVLSGHPHLYTDRYRGKHSWGEHLRRQTEHGFIVREPQEDFAPYMIAADVLLTDHSGLGVYGALLEKPAVFTVIDDKYILEDSPTWRYRAMSPILSDVSKLKATLSHAVADYPYARLRELSRDIHSCPGESEDRIRKVVYKLLSLPPRQEPS